ncbi:MAG: chemotaxis protein CheD [Gemmatimonadaceae bacterium]
MADLAVAGGDVRLVTVGLGSCVAIVLHDPTTGIGGLAHILLPSPAMSRESDNPAKFPSTAVPVLLNDMARLGASERISARLVGGASMFRSLLAVGGVNVGERNIIASREALDASGIALVAEDTGGEYGRSVYFDVATGLLSVRSMSMGDREL